MRHGKISYEVGMSCREKQDSDLQRGRKQLLKTTFYRTGNGSVSYKNDKLKASAPTVDRGCCSKFRACCSWIWSFMVACWRCMVAFWERIVACSKNVVHCFGNI